MAQCDVEELGHTAEVGLRVRADAPEQLYACAAAGMFELLRVDVDRRRPPLTQTVTVDSIDGESLMVDWLSELLYLHETTGAIFADCVVTQWRATQLKAEVTGYPPVSPPAVHIKAVTYHQLSIRAAADGWTATVFFDI